jgi:DNA-directed RNA polymerase specialized sigma24 family protein
MGSKWEELEHLVRRIARRHLRDENDVDDVAARVALEFVRRSDVIRKPSSWAKKVTENALRDLFRRRRRAPLGTDHLAGVAAKAEPPRTAALSALQEEKELLTPDEQTYADTPHGSVAEAARRLGCSLRTFSNRRRNVLRKLNRRLVARGFNEADLAFQVGGFREGEPPFDPARTEPRPPRSANGQLEHQAPDCVHPCDPVVTAFLDLADALRTLSSEPSRSVREQITKMDRVIAAAERLIANATSKT